MDDPFLFRSKNASELWLIRHGDAIPGPDEIIPSRVYDDLPLSKTGREQARALAERLGDTHFDAIYTSPLKRCQQTAAPLAERLNLTPAIVPDIREIYIGEIRPLPTGTNDLEALSKALQERQIDIVRIAGEDGNWDAIKNSEPASEFRHRIITALDEIASKHGGQRVLVFAHGGVINAYVAAVLGLQKDFFFPCGNTSITVVRVAGSRRILYVMNDIAHVKRRG